MSRSGSSFLGALVLASAFVVGPALAAGGGTGGGGGGGGAAGGGGGGGGGMQIATHNGLYVVDQPQPGEASMSGFVQAALAGSYFTPPDTVVTVNGVQLIHAPGLVSGFFIVDPNGPQPAVGADGFLHLSASSASAKSSRLLDLACPARVVVTSTPAAGSSLSGVAQLDLAWTPLPQNPPTITTSSFAPDQPTARLFAYDIASGTISGFVGGFTLSQASVGTSIPVTPTGSTGYMSELRYPGVYRLDGNSGGYCGRAQRYTYMQ